MQLVGPSSVFGNFQQNGKQWIGQNGIKLYAWGVWSISLSGMHICFVVLGAEFLTLYQGLEVFFFLKQNHYLGLLFY